ncbi:hypothetical protein K492DRAFT_159733 [Lichtheimia hyalospora FSU 10163]|nr:hypothetical protein K492DRAFT_159733 [Lichtheimia hyalospora FSU 10163]
MMLIDIAIPLALYYGLRNVIDVIYALIISGIPPFLWVIVGFIRSRRVDVLGVIISLSFILSGVVSLISGDARAALLRDSAVTGVVGLMFLLTLPPIKSKWLTVRPLTFIMARQMFSEASYRWIDKDGNKCEMGVVDWQWEHIRYFRISMYAQTAAWGILLVMELVACVLMVESSLSIDNIVAYNNIITSVVVAVMVTLSILAGIYGHRVEKRVGTAWTKENDYTDYYENLSSNNNNNNQDVDGSLSSIKLDHGNRKHHHTENMA